MNRERLERLIVVLEQVQETERDLFDMDTWFCADEDPSHWTEVRDNNTRIVPEEMHECSTAACAAGFAALDPVLNEQGFLLDDDMPFFNYATGYVACKAFFGLTHAQADYLFFPGTYNDRPTAISPMDVVKRVREVLAGYDPE